MDDKSEVYIVEKIMKRRVRRGRTEYYVKWKGWGDADSTWEPEGNILDPHLIDIFNKQQKFEQANKKKSKRSHAVATSIAELQPPELIRHDADDNISINNEASSSSSTKHSTTECKTNEDEPPIKSLKTIKRNDNDDSSSSEDEVPLAKRKENHGPTNKRKREVLSKLFPKESGIIGVKITTSPPIHTQKIAKSNPTTRPADTTNKIIIKKPIDVISNNNSFQDHQSSTYCISKTQKIEEKPKSPTVEVILESNSTKLVDTNNGIADSTKTELKKEITEPKIDDNSFLLKNVQKSDFNQMSSTLTQSSVVEKVEPKIDLENVNHESTNGTNEDVKTEEITSNSNQDLNESVIESSSKNDSSNEQNKITTNIYKTVLTNPGYEYWKNKAPVADKVVITDVQVNHNTVTILECPMEKGFFNLALNNDKKSVSMTISSSL